MAVTRPSFVGLYVTKHNFRNSISKYSVSPSPEFYGIVISEYFQKGGRIAEVLIFPSGRIEKILKARLQLLPEDICKLKMRSHIKFDEFQQKLVGKMHKYANT